MSVVAGTVPRMNARRISALVTDPPPLLRQEPPTGPAYAVPWRVLTREPGSRIVLWNASPERLRHVRAALVAEGETAMTLPLGVGAWARLAVSLRGLKPGAGDYLSLRWLRADDREYLWLVCPE